MATPTPSEQLSLSFGENFLEHHAGQIIDDPRYAIVELVANAWDAGAGNVEIKWPDKIGDTILIHDDGLGMTKEEFSFRWGKLNYNRIALQGRNVEFPKGRSGRQRTAFGKNGIGRHAMFCFCNEYIVETHKDGQKTRARVIKTPKGDFPYSVEILENQTSKTSTMHGTTISGVANKNISLSQNTILKVVGSKFIADPEFVLSINSIKVDFEELEQESDITEINIENVGIVKVKRFEGENNRTTQHQGVAWWVNRRLVGTPSWENVSGRLIDGRNAIAKRYVYIVEADILKPFVKADWSGFHASPELNNVLKKVYDHINEDLITLLTASRTERKNDAFSANKDLIKTLPAHIRQDISEIIDEFQKDCPTFGVNELESTVKVLANMEKSRSGYSLLEKLAQLKANDLDSLNAILDEWSISDIKKIMNELQWRLDLINKLEPLVNNSNADELHDLQPLFERGLWIFGPEFESLSFTSNRTLATIVKKYFGNAALESPGRRPDFVVVPDSSIGVYSRDGYDDEHNVSGIDCVVIVELKRGGFKLGYQEKDQAKNYAREIRKAGHVDKSTKIICYVLGSSIDSEGDVADPGYEGHTSIIPRRYSSVLKQAHARTFNLLSKIEWAHKSISNLEEQNNLFAQ
ncbi:ATP-binding protein [Pseudobacter ginsenosidimutans]|uniref:Histidine kinase/DNA gyrase B/HSP90-like ATPase n=1 Tax=Pseudobacter ginsenosidimutans TaxID=661488 RepID=A0A4Q7N5I9_9BACT|nr:ATP-binding protein [Pseudobacter ginsenosidimutans]QEC44818.1 hypothetical protein FSB84_25215 [Pseudobacter ginsenosidimutans]RZS76308.1 histidine kinase/DNA gyrase B/HSP90-like ATPase [Pseudobacter ginsenosidimutans]